MGKYLNATLTIHESIAAVHIRVAVFLDIPAFSVLGGERKNLDIREFLGDYLEPISGDIKLKPYCPEVPTSLLSMDHLTGVRMRRHLHAISENGLKDAFQVRFLHFGRGHILTFALFTEFAR